MADMIFDGHLDLAMNALEWNRDLRCEIDQIRMQEQGMTDKPDRSRGTVCFPEMRKGNVAICIATQIARYVKPDNRLPGWRSPEQAWAMTQGQLAWYRAMENAGEMVQIIDRKSLENHLSRWNNPSGKLPLGYILSLEGADSLVNLNYLEKAYQYGLRAIGPAHYGPGIYAQGTDASGSLPEKGKDLLREMEQLKMILDVSHLNDTCFYEALEIFHGTVLASHNNCRAFVPHNRQITDEQIRALIDRDAVIGVAFDAWMLVEWKRGESTPESTGVSLNHVVQNIDHICQIAGNSEHAAIGSDLDGAFGKEQSPGEIDTIADIQKISALLETRGYSHSDITNILSGNWVRFLMKAWE